MKKYLLCLDDVYSLEELNKKQLNYCIKNNYKIAYIKGVSSRSKIFT